MTFTPHPLAALRAERNLTQNALSAQAGVSTSSIARVESGAMIVHGHVLFKIASALDVPIEAIINEGQAGISERSIAARYLGISECELDELKEAIER